MEKRDVEGVVKKIIADQLNKEIKEIKSEQGLAKDLKADSLDTVELIMSFEESFGIQIPDEVSTKIQTVKDAVNYIKSKV